MHNNMKAFLDMLAWSEIGPVLLAKSDNGYNVFYTGKLFDSYHDHPNKLHCASIKGKQVCSTAAGRYQILYRYWKVYKQQLNLRDFGKLSQDAVAMQLIKECKAVQDIEAGRITSAINKCASRWASLPGAGYNQHENRLHDLREAYRKAGGQFSDC